MADPVSTEEQTGEQNGEQVDNPPTETTDDETTTPLKAGESIFASKSKDDPAKIFVGGLNSSTTNESLHAHFSQYGQVVDVNVKYTQERMGNLRDTNEQNARSRGFGFVLFASPEAAKEIIGMEHIVDGKKIEVKKAIRHGQPRSKKLFVGGISNCISDEILNAYFSAFGVIIETKVILDHLTQKRRGFAFIQFEDETTVDDIAAVKYHELTNGTEKCRVEVKPVQPQDRFKEGGFRGRAGFRGGFRGNDRGGGFGRGGGGGRGGFGQQQGYQGGGEHYNYGQDRWAGYNQGGYQEGGGYYQGSYDQSAYNQPAYNQQYDQQYQGYYNYPNYGQNQDASGQYANGAGYQSGYQGNYDASSYGGAQPQYNYDTNYGQEASNYGKAQTGGNQHNAYQPY